MHPVHFFYSFLFHYLLFIISFLKSSTDFLVMFCDNFLKLVVEKQNKEKHTI